MLSEDQKEELEKLSSTQIVYRLRGKGYKLSRAANIARAIQSRSWHKLTEQEIKDVVEKDS